MRLIDYFDRGAKRYPERVCLTDERRQLSYREVEALTHRIGLALIANGIEAQTVGAVLSHNDIDAFACILGLLRAGCAWMPVNARNSVEDNAYILDHNECAWLFYHSAFAGEIERSALGRRRSAASSASTASTPATPGCRTGWPATRASHPTSPSARTISPRSGPRAARLGAPRG